ncbi:MAG: hypothetical protein JXQ90_01285 [Cyclobacteriaceae bacterium]
MNSRAVFHKISYLQYPLYLLGLYWLYRPVIFRFNEIRSDLSILFTDFNIGLIFIGIGVSISTLQDTRKTQNKLSKKIWQNPKYSRWALIILFLLTMIVIGMGVYFLLFPKEYKIEDLAVGLIVLGIGYINILKSAMEMAANHQGKEF